MNPIAEYIKESGPISVEDFMKRALYNPAYGYYAQKMPLGADGDFITAPEISQMFGELIGACLQDVWMRMGCPGSIHLIELGPGRGTLMSDLLRAVSNNFKQTIDLHFVETSEDLKAFQKQAVNNPAQWHSQVEDALKACTQAPLFVLGNEFFDALPVQQYQYNQGDWRERYVMWDDATQGLTFTLGDRLETNEFPNAREGDVFEINPMAQNIMSTISSAVAKQGGLGLFIDYGHDKTHVGDTLQAISQHKKVSFFDEPGFADLTSHVDFEALGDKAKEQGLDVMGPTYQRNFLNELGLHIRAQHLLRRANLAQQQQITKAMKRLTDPKEMGTLFKVIAMKHKKTPTIVGFESCIKQAV